VITATCHVCFVSHTSEGNASAKRLAELAGSPLPAGSGLYQEKGFQGCDLQDVRSVQPKKTPPGGELTPPEKATNRRISSSRIRSEHAIGGVKCDRIVKDTIRPQPVKIDNELHVRDYSRCILCYKCVEACGVEAQNTFAIAVAGRGFDARISTEFAVPLTDSACVYCGNCISVCPTGALMSRSEYEMRQAGTWSEAAQTHTDTICPYCGVGCTLTLYVQDNQIVNVTSPLEHQVGHGHLCIKGRFGWQFVQNRADHKQPS
jgi:predicted molibdopterin-dependent oxidoreductase YjgC